MEMDPISYDEHVPEDDEAFSDYGDQPIEVDLTIHCPPVSRTVPPRDSGTHHPPSGMH